MDMLAFIGFLFVIYTLIYLIFPWFADCDIYLAFQEKFGKSTSTLKDKVVWITGASSGIGEELAYVLSHAGCKVILSARREAELHRVKQKCLEGNIHLQPHDIEILPLDVCQIEMHKTALDRILSKFGQLDILVNNAGRSQRANWEEIELDVDKQMFDLNVFAAVSLSRLAGKYFLQSNKGHFVVISSLAGITPVPHSATYTGTKHALQGYFGSWRMEKLGTNIPVTLVCAGPIQTNFLSECFTAKSGEKYDVATDVSQTKVSARRCADLIAIAIANELSEIWIAKPTPLFLTYLTQYYPLVGALVMKFLGPRYLARLRDDKAAK